MLEVFYRKKVTDGDVSMIFAKNIVRYLCLICALQPFYLNAQEARENELFTLDISDSASYLESLGMQASVTDDGVFFKFPESEHRLFIRSVNSPAVASELEASIADEPEGLADFFDGSKVAAALPVYDVSELIDVLFEQNKPFLGPVVGVDGVYQLFVFIPGIGYIDFYSTKMPDQDHIEYVEIWDNVLEDIDPSDILFRTPSIGTPIGEPFNSLDEHEPKDSISVIQITWGDYIQSLSIGYRSGHKVNYGHYHGPNGDRAFLDEDEVIIDGFVCEDNASTQGDKFIRYMHFVTSKGRELSFGEISHQCLMFSIPQDHMIEGFYGHFDSFVYQIGAIYTPLPLD